MATLNVQGRLYKVMDTQQVSASFRKREFVLEIPDGQYPQFVSFQLTQDRVSLLDPFQQGATVDVAFNLRGREWQSPQGEVKYFNSLDAWRISPAIAGAQQPADQAPAYTNPNNGGGFSESSNAGFTAPSSDPAKDDLPF